MIRKVFQLFVFLLPILMLSSCGDGEHNASERSAEPAQQEAPPADGIHEMRDKDGILIMRGEKINGKRHGDWESYFPDGSLRSRATYEHGQRQGTSTVFHENGKPFYTGIYRDDRMVGDWLFFDEEGKSVKMVRYDNQGNKLEEKAL